MFCVDCVIVFKLFSQFDICIRGVPCLLPYAHLMKRNLHETQTPGAAIQRACLKTLFLFELKILKVIMTFCS